MPHGLHDMCLFLYRQFNINEIQHKFRDGMHGVTSFTKRNIFRRGRNGVDHKRKHFEYGPRGLCPSGRGRQDD